jgi:hypothetical protein
MRKPLRVESLLAALLLFAVHISPLRAEGSRTPLQEELNAVTQSIAEGHIGQGIDRLSAFRQQMDPQKDPNGYWTASQRLLDLLLQIEDTVRAEQVLKSIVESKIGASNPAIFSWTQLYIGELLYIAGHGTEGQKFLRALTVGDKRLVLIPAQRAAAVLLSRIELQQGNVAQSAIWMRRAVVGVFEDKGAGSEEIVDALTEYAQFLSATRRFLDAFNIYSKLAPVYGQAFPHTSPKYLRFQSLFLGAAAEVGNFNAANDLYSRLNESAGRVDLVAPSVKDILFFQGLYQKARSLSQSDRDTLRRQVVDIVDKGSDLLRYGLNRMIFMYFALLCEDIDLAERVEKSPVAQITESVQVDAYRDALDSLIAARRGKFDNSISLLERSRSKIEEFHRQFEAETIDQLPAISAEERVVVSSILAMDLPQARSLSQENTLFKVGQFLNRDRTKLGLNQSVSRRGLRSELQREDASTRDRLRDFRDRLLRDTTAKLLSGVFPIRPPSVVKHDFSVLFHLEDIEDRLLIEDRVVVGEVDRHANESTRDIASVQGLLKNDEALILQNLVPNGLAVQCLTSKELVSRVTVYQQPEIAQLIDDEKKITDLLHSSAPPVKQMDNSSQFPFEGANRLFRFFFGASNDCISGTAHILLATDPDLFAEPWNAFVTDLPPAGKVVGFREAAWLPRKYAISLLPSVRSIYDIRQLLQRSRASRIFLGVGDPDLGAPQQSAALTLGPLFESRGVANVAQIKALPRLPDSGAELRSEARALGAGDTDLLLGAEATERSLRLRQVRDYRVISFATHAIVAGEIPGTTEPALILTPMDSASQAPENGLLTATKIANLGLDANLVILSACNTAAPDGRASGRGLSGLADAFFLAGARAIAVTQWAVFSSSSEKLASDLILQSTKHASVGAAEGLRSAMLDYISDAETDWLANPRFWAAYVIAGDGAVNPSDFTPAADSDVITRNIEHLLPEAADQDLLDAVRTPQNQIYAVGMEQPPIGEKTAGSYIVEIDTSGTPLIVKREPAFAVSGVDAVGDQIAVLGYRPSEYKSAAVFEMLDSNADRRWEYVEDAGYLNIPFGIVPAGPNYLLISIQTDYSSNNHNVLVITRVSSEGVRVDQKRISVSIRPDAGLPRNIVVLASHRLVIAVRGNVTLDPKRPPKMWINPETGTLRFCTQTLATEVFQVDPETLAVEKSKTLDDLYITSLNLTNGRIFAAGASTSNCRFEKQTNIVEILNDFETRKIFQSFSVNSLEVLDMQVTEKGQFLLGGRVTNFFPKNPIPSIDPASQPGTPQFDPWNEELWETTEFRFSGFLLLADKDGSLLGDKVFSDPRSRNISTVRTWVDDKALVFGSAFGGRGWLAEVKLTVPSAAGGPN